MSKIMNASWSLPRNNEKLHCMFSKLLQAFEESIDWFCS